MPTRYFRRRQPSTVLRTWRRRSAVVPGRQIQPVRPGPVRNAPIYTYQPSSVAHRKLIHVNPLVSEPSDTLWANNLWNAGGSQPSILPLNLVVQGDGLNARHANKIYMQDLQLTIIPVPKTPAVTSSSGTIGGIVAYADIAVIYDRESRGVVPLITDVFDAAYEDSMQRVVNRERFDVLYRYRYRRCLMPCWDGTQVRFWPSQASVTPISVKVPINRGTVYSGPNAAMADIVKGGLFLVIFNAQTPAATNSEFEVLRRLQFVDVE